MARKKIFYLMHVPWNWIKQRPHFIAENLSASFHIEIFNLQHYGAKKLTTNSFALRQHTMFRLPSNRNRVVRYINNKLVKLQIRNALRPFNMVWLTTPAYLPYLSEGARKKPLIYDCMDDILAFSAVKENDAMYREYFELEKELVLVANLVLCSSDYLKEKLVKRFAIRDANNIHVVNNGIKLYEHEQEVDLPRHLASAYSSSEKVLTYIGTISDWFDFDLILDMLNQHPKLQVFLFGPAEVGIPKHERLVHFGPVEHKVVFSIMKRAEVLVMPFVVNELIKAVNPVKAYEYIYSNKMVLLSHYGETEKFADFVYLYRGRDEFNKHVNDYVHGNLKPKRSRQECIAYAQQNTWTNRAATIRDLIEKTVL